MTPAPAHIQLVLVSHTNAGKTTLARTLVGMDLGEVRDAPHVTTQSDAHTLWTGPHGDLLQLWDTPGFGDSVRLFKRLRLAGNPLGWFLREVVDRYRERPFWLSQQAMRTAREAADVVLYLVNASEDPQDAGYLDAEMKILQWLDKPVLILLNQMGPPRPQAQEEAEQARWHALLSVYPMVKQVIPLDAFARCWVHERVFYDAVGACVPAAKQGAYQRFLAHWEQRHQARLQAAVDLIATQLAAAVRDSEAVKTPDAAGLDRLLGAVGLGRRTGEKRQAKAWNALVERLGAGILHSTTGLLRLHQLDAGAAATIHTRVEQSFVVRAPVDTTQAGLLGSVLSGAAAGLSADLIAGGLSFGAGALVGGILGALGFAGAAWAFNVSTDRNAETLQFSDAFLRAQLVAVVLRYLAVAHFGRGRGAFEASEAPGFWQVEVEAVLAQHETLLAKTWDNARKAASPEVAAQLVALVVLPVVTQVLQRLYPHATAQGSHHRPR
jgi:hypothetical protein